MRRILTDYSTEMSKTWTEERTHPVDGYKIIEHHTEGITLFPGLGKKCDYCECYFANNYDEYLHLEAFGRRPHGRNPEDVDPDSLDGLDWRKSDFDDGWFTPVGKNTMLAQACKMKHRLRIGVWEYSVSKNGKWLKRRKPKS